MTTLRIESETLNSSSSLVLCSLYHHNFTWRRYALQPVLLFCWILSHSFPESHVFFSIDDVLFSPLYSMTLTPAVLCCYVLRYFSSLYVAFMLDVSKSLLHNFPCISTEHSVCSCFITATHFMSRMWGNVFTAWVLFVLRNFYNSLPLHLGTLPGSVVALCSWIWPLPKFTITTSVAYRFFLLQPLEPSPLALRSSPSSARFGFAKIFGFQLSDHSRPSHLLFGLLSLLPIPIKYLMKCPSIHSFQMPTQFASYGTILFRTLKRVSFLADWFVIWFFLL